MSDNIAKFSFVLNERDYINFNFWFLYGNPRGMTSLITALLLLIASPVMFYLGHVKDDYFFSFIAPLALATSIIYLIYMPLRMFYQSKSHYKSNSVLQNEHSFEADQKGISVVTGSFSGFVKWSDVYKVGQSRNYLFVFIAKNKAFILPKRFIENIDFLKTIINTNVPWNKTKIR